MERRVWRRLWIHYGYLRLGFFTKVGSFDSFVFILLLMLVSFLENGKLITWGSSDDEGQSYVASGKHGVKFIKDDDLFCVSAS